MIRVNRKLSTFDDCQYREFSALWKFVYFAQRAGRGQRTQAQVPATISRHVLWACDEKSAEALLVPSKAG
jgi:hypothetical protein